MPRNILAVLLLTGVVVAAIADMATLSVMDMNTSAGLSAGETGMLTDRLLNELVVHGAYKVVERSLRDEILKEQGFQGSGACDQSSCLVEAGQMLGVQKMVGGTIGKIGSIYAVELRVMDVATGGIDKVFSRKCTDEVSDLLDAMTDAAAVFSGRKLSEDPARLSTDRYAMIYVYRPKSASLNTQFPVIFNGRPIHQMPRHSRFLYKVYSQGIIRAEFAGNVKFDFTVEHGKSYYIRSPNNGRSELVNEDKGKAEFNDETLYPNGLVKMEEDPANPIIAGRAPSR